MEENILITKQKHCREKFRKRHTTKNKNIEQQKINGRIKFSSKKPVFQGLRFVHVQRRKVFGSANIETSVLRNYHLKSVFISIDSFFYLSCKRILQKGNQ